MLPDDEREQAIRLAAERLWEDNFRDEKSAGSHLNDVRFLLRRLDEARRMLTPAEP